MLKECQDIRIELNLGWHTVYEFVLLRIIVVAVTHVSMEMRANQFCFTANTAAAEILPISGVPD